MSDATTTTRPQMIDCPRCGHPCHTNDFEGGVCDLCYESERQALEKFNAEHDRWDRMAAKQREDAIKWASR